MCRSDSRGASTTKRSDDKNNFWCPMYGPALKATLKFAGYYTQMAPKMTSGKKLVHVILGLLFRLVLHGALCDDSQIDENEGGRIYPKIDMYGAAVYEWKHRNGW
eukprot:CAMPEP_0181053370 /NCGR_PEP_ID=MMETSP1070-20121207/18074_1 /TAXON_ID=265543 /ORGANISM="Minutocellus polymorphus, Strain NH13" /LENGTH=104 /DNA_ID=CAMNT_0023132499 /DNA_START=317 /DNA_END=628 /DNA_ORIENTATION=-